MKGNGQDNVGTVDLDRWENEEGRCYLSIRIVPRVRNAKRDTTSVQPVRLGNLQISERGRRCHFGRVHRDPSRS